MAQKPYSKLQVEDARRIYANARQAVIGKFSNPADQAKAVSRFESDPRVRAIRARAEYTPVETRKQAVKETARQVVAANRAAPSVIPMGIRDMGAALMGSANDALLGLPARVAAGITGAPNDVMQEFADQQGQRAPVTNILGTLAGSLVSGGAIAGGLKALGTRAAASSAPLLAKAGNVLQSATQLQKGQKLKNVARVAGAGATAGGVDAAIKDRSIAGGAALGGVAAPVLHGVMSGTVAGAKGLRNLAGFEPVDQILAKYVKTPVKEIQKRMQDRASKGLPSSIYEVLPLGDRQLLDDAIGKMPAQSRERLATAVRQRAKNMVQETAARIKAITAPRMQQAKSSLASDLAASRGAEKILPAESRLAERASRSVMDMETLAAVEARNIMKPHDAKQAFDSVESLVPQHPVTQADGTIAMVESSPEISAMIRKAAGLLRSKNEPLKVKEVTDIMSRLRRRVNSEEGDIAREALEHITDLLETELPDIAKDVTRMRSQWHARLSSMEGMREGARGRLRQDIMEPTQKTRNAFETAAGRTGRAMGQGAQLERDLLVSPDASLRAMSEIADNPTAQRAISQNLGAGAGEDIASVARAQSESARSLGRLASERGGDPVMEGTKLLQSIMMLAPNTLPSTKAFALSRLVQGSLRIPEKQAGEIVEMLFSQNPTQISRAITSLSKFGEAGQQAIRTIGRDLAVGAMAASGATPNEYQGDPYTATIDAPSASEPDYSQMSDEELMQAVGSEPDYSQMSDEELMQAVGDTDPLEGDAPYGRQVIESIFPDAEITDDVRDPLSSLGQSNPGSYHVQSDGAVDLRPIPGMSFEQFVQSIQDAGYEVVEAIDETRNPSSHATGPHWHIVLA